MTLVVYLQQAVFVLIFLSIYHILTNKKQKESLFSKIARLNQYFLSSGKEYKAILWGLSVIVALLFYAYTIKPESLVTESATSMNIILTNIQILATIFALVLTITYFGLDQLSRNLTPRLVMQFTHSPFFLTLFLSYGISILAHITAISFDSPTTPEKFAFYSNLLLVWNIFYLFAYFFYTLSAVQPHMVLKSLDSKIPKKYKEFITQITQEQFAYEGSENNHLLSLEAMIVQYIRTNQYDSYVRGLNLLSSRYKNYLLELRTYREQNNLLYDTIHYEAEIITAYILNIYKRIYYEITKANNEIFLKHYMIWIAKNFQVLITLKSIRPLSEFQEHFNKIGVDIIEKDFDSNFMPYTGALEQVAEKELVDVLSSKYTVLNFQDQTKSFTEMTKSEQELWVLGDMALMSFQNRLKHISELCKLTAKKGGQEHLWFLPNIFQKLLNEVIKKSDKDSTRAFLVRAIIDRMNEVHSFNIEYKTGVTYLPILGMPHLLDDIQDKNMMDTLGKFICYHYCKAEKESVQNDVYWALHSLGYSGRTILHKYPKEEELQTLIVNTLLDCLDFVAKNGKRFKNINKLHVAKELNSLIRWKIKGKLAFKIKKKLKEHRIKTNKIGSVYSELTV